MKRHHDFGNETRKRVDYEQREVIDLTFDGPESALTGAGGTMHVLDNLDGMDEEFFKSIDIVESKYIATQNVNLDNIINEDISISTLQNGSEEQLNQLRNELQIKTGEICFLRKNESNLSEENKRLMDTITSQKMLENQAHLQNVKKLNRQIEQLKSELFFKNEELQKAKNASASVQPPQRTSLKKTRDVGINTNKIQEKSTEFKGMSSSSFPITIPPRKINIRVTPIVSSVNILQVKIKSVIQTFNASKYIYLTKSPTLNKNILLYIEELTKSPLDLASSTFRILDECLSHKHYSILSLLLPPLSLFNISHDDPSHTLFTIVTLLAHSCRVKHVPLDPTLPLHLTKLLTLYRNAIGYMTSKQEFVEVFYYLCDARHGCDMSCLVAMLVCENALRYQCVSGTSLERVCVMKEGVRCLFRACLDGLDVSGYFRENDGAWISFLDAFKRYEREGNDTNIMEIWLFVLGKVLPFMGTCVRTSAITSLLTRMQHDLDKWTMLRSKAKAILSLIH